jgi:hypothetical protein
MTDCLDLSDRMPAVAHGRLQWSAAEAAHLTECRDCAAEWRIVQAGLQLHAGLTLDSAQTADAVVTRLRAAPHGRGIIHRIPWRSGLVGLVAAAASVAIIFSTPKSATLPPIGVIDSAAAIAILPELQGLNDTQLEAMLHSLGPTAGDAAPGLVPHLEDLTDGELEQLIQTQGD